MNHRTVIAGKFAVTAASRFFGSTVRTPSGEAVLRNVSSGFGGNGGNVGYWVRVPLINGGSVRYSSSVSVEQKEKESSPAATDLKEGSVEENEKAAMSYWGIEAAKIKKSDGTDWKWNCFRVCIM